MHALSKRVAQEDGFAVVLALFVIVLTVVLAGTLVTGAVVTSSHGNKDYAQKRALAAANAGLQAALYRLSTQSEDNSTQQAECFTTAYVSEVAGNGCPYQEDELVSNIKYKYYVTPDLTKAANNCTGLWLTVPREKESTLGVNQRCVTAIGTAYGAVARVQARVADTVAITTTSIANPFPVNGIYSWSSLELTGKVKLSGEVGARTKLESNQEVENTTPVTAVYGEKIKLKCKIACTEQKLSAEQTSKAPYALPTPETSAFAASAATNSNLTMTISTGSYEVAKREPVVKSNPGTVTLPSGTYNFCEINWSGKVTVNYKPPVKLYIDSPNRTGSGCPAGSGLVSITNENSFNDEGVPKKASDLQIYVWGNPSVTPPGPSSPSFKINNKLGGPMYAQIYAPYSKFETNNELSLVGAIAAGWIKSNNSIEVKGESAGAGSEGTTITSVANSNFYVTAYHQCPSTYSSPTTGCY